MVVAFWVEQFEKKVFFCSIYFYCLFWCLKQRFFIRFSNLNLNQKNLISFCFEWKLLSWIRIAFVSCMFKWVIVGLVMLSLFQIVNVNVINQWSSRIFPIYFIYDFCIVSSRSIFVLFFFWIFPICYYKCSIVSRNKYTFSSSYHRL